MQFLLGLIVFVHKKFTKVHVPSQMRVQAMGKQSST